jgi:hypothetical protein
LCWGQKSKGMWNIIFAMIHLSVFLRMRILQFLVNCVVILDQFWDRMKWGIS